MRRVAKVAAGAGVLGSNQHEVGGVSDRAGGSGNRNFSGDAFQWLAQHLNQVLAKFGQLVEKKHAPVRQADLPRPGPGTAANQAGIADGVVRSAKRPISDQRRIGRQQTGKAQIVIELVPAKMKGIDGVTDEGWNKVAGNDEPIKQIADKPRKRIA